MKNVIVLAIALSFFLFSNLAFGQLLPNAEKIDDLSGCIFSYDKLTITGGPKASTKDYFFKNKKFTGCAIKYVTQGVNYYGYEFENGKLQRLICVYSNGQLERDFRFKKGVEVGTQRMWFSNGSKYIEGTYDNGNPVKLLRWYNNGQLAREVNFKKGVLVNELLYKRDGTIISKK